MRVTAINDAPPSGFLAWIRRERLVDIQHDPVACQYRVRIMRRGGGRTVRIFDEMLLAQARRHPLEIMAASFPDSIDRLALRLLGGDQLPGWAERQGQGGSPGSGDPGAPPAPRSEPYSRGQRSASAEPIAWAGRPRAGRLRELPEPTPGGEILAPPSSRVPFYRPR